MPVPTDQHTTDALLAKRKPPRPGSKRPAFTTKTGASGRIAALRRPMVRAETEGRENRCGDEAAAAAGRWLGRRGRVTGGPGGLLSGTMLEGREVVVIDRAPSGKAVFAVEVESAGEVLDVWKTAARLVPQTGRWPIISSGAPAQPIVEPLTSPAGGPAQFDQLAPGIFRALDEEKAHALDGIEGWTGTTYRDFLDFHLNNTKHRCGVAQSEGEITRALPDAADEMVLDHWLMGWQEERQPTTGAEGGQHLEWFF